MSDRRPRARYAALLFSLAGFGIAAAGAHLLWRTTDTDSLIRIGEAVRDGEIRLPPAALLSTAGRLNDTSAGHWTGDDAGASTFLYYAAAEESQKAGKAADAQHEMAQAMDMARQTLRVAPTRADVALALAEMTYLSGSTFDAVTQPLILSYQTAPRELWIIRRRIALGLRLADKADPELLGHIVNDIRTLGEPFHDPIYYSELASAAYGAGPFATALVRRQLAETSDTTLTIFDQDIAKLAQSRPAGAR